MEIRSVGVVGCGLMGHGIVQVAAAAGFEVVAFESDARALERGIARIEASLEKIAAKSVGKGETTAGEARERLTATRARIRPSTAIGDLADRDLVIEAIVEDLAAKRSLFRELGTSCASHAILASNTSSFPIGELAQASGRPARTVGLHFFNPVQLMQLVEVVRTDASDPAAVDAALAFAQRCGKTAITCRDTPGFVVNRLLVPFLAEALRMVERGDASPQDVDTAMQLGAGHPMGPITLADYVGLDTTLSILEGWCQRFPDEPAFAVPESLRRKVREGAFGRKSGRGFYTWSGDKRV